MTEYESWYFEVAEYFRLLCGRKIILNSDEFAEMISNYWDGLESREQAVLLAKKP